MKYIDITGTLANGMWEFGPPFPQVHIEAHKGFMDGFGEFNYTAIDGLHALTGTYVETPAHYYGYEKSYLIEDVPLEKLVDLPCVVMNVTPKPDAEGRGYIELEDLLACPNSKSVQKGDALIVGFGDWGDKMWFSQDHFPKSPYFSYDAFMWLLDQEPCVIGSDTSSWEKLDGPSGFFDRFYAQNVLMLAGLNNLKSVTKPRVKLSILPIKVANTCAAPCRAFIAE